MYKLDGGDKYLYKNEAGNWTVGDTAGYSTCNLGQISNNSLSPYKTIPWMYSDGGWQDDVTFRVYPCYYEDDDRQILQCI